MAVDVLTPASREEWLALRKRTVGASEVAALLGCHPFVTAYEIWHLKAGTVQSDPTETGPMRRGRHLEKVAVEFLREERPTWTVNGNEIPGGRFYRDMELGISCTPDAFLHDPEREGGGLAQIKSVEPSVFRKKWKAEDGAVEPPLFIVLQAIQEAYLTGSAWAIVCPLVIGFAIELPVIEIPLHVGIMEKIKAEVAAFWRSIEAGAAPEPDYAKDGAAIARVFADDNGQELDLTTDNRLPEILGEREVLKDTIKTAEAKVATIDAEFKHRLGSYEAALLAGKRRVTWRTQHRKGFTVEPSSFRVLRFGNSK